MCILDVKAWFEEVRETPVFWDEVDDVVQDIGEYDEFLAEKVKELFIRARNAGIAEE